MPHPRFGLLRFDEGYFDRLWGGTRLRATLRKPIPPERTVGEAWLLSDHEEFESRVIAGPHQGRTLQDLLALDEAALLGTRARRTIHGRFPLLLKLLDSAQALSVQVHPNDADAARLGEKDVGKTEMWQVLEAEPGAELICGLQPDVTRDDVAHAIAAGTLEERLVRFPSPPGTTAFIPAGTVHAIGGGILLAEIQQNSNITYRLYDWNRVDENGAPRALHIEKGLEVTDFSAAHTGPNKPLSYCHDGVRCDILAACKYFLAEMLHVEQRCRRALDGGSFHILLAAQGALDIEAENGAVHLAPGEAALSPAEIPAYIVAGAGVLLDYSVPNWQRNVVAPLLEAGHAPERIAALGGGAAWQHP